MNTCNLVLFLSYLGYCYSLNDFCECGKSSLSPFTARIVGGSDAKLHEFPWTVALYYNKKLYCGATIINDKFILTAGHCVRWANPSKLTVILGMHLQIPMDGIEAEIEKIILHEKFYSQIMYDDNDIALIKVKEQILFNENIQPVCLPKSNNLLIRRKTIVGWGRFDKTSENNSNILKKTNVRILTNEECKKTQMAPYLSDTNFCAYGINSDACQGDSGGALLSIRKSGKTELTGIVSWGIGCALPNIPGIYIKVEKYIPWILNNTQDSIYCKNI